MLKIAICGDDRNFMGVLDSLLIEISKQHQIKILPPEAFFRGDDLLRELQKGEAFDLFYLEIGMEPDGISLAKQIRSIHERALFVFVSGHREYYEQLFEIDTFDFIRKPIDRTRVEDVFLRAYKKIGNMREKEFFLYNYGSDRNQIFLDAILYFQSTGRQIEIHLRNGEVKTYNGKLDEVEANVKGKKMSFIRVHQSYLVSYEWITGYRREKVKMINGEELPTSAGRRAKFVQCFHKLGGCDISE